MRTISAVSKASTREKDGIRAKTTLLFEPLREHMARTITVRGMSCGGCESTVEEALTGVEGITDAEADRELERATVEGDADPDALVSAVEDAGYEAEA